MNERIKELLKTILWWAGVIVFAVLNTAGLFLFGLAVKGAWSL